MKYTYPSDSCGHTICKLHLKSCLHFMEKLTTKYNNKQTNWQGKELQDMRALFFLRSDQSQNKNHSENQVMLYTVFLVWQSIVMCTHQFWAWNEHINMHKAIETPTRCEVHAVICFNQEGCNSGTFMSDGKVWQ